jgi:5-formyltetrahydrofolate cyclo-ligase
MSLGAAEHGAGMTIRVLKESVRAEALTARSSLSDEIRSAFAGELASAGLAAARRWAARPGLVVSVFWPIRDEPDTRPLLAALSEAGFRVALPVTPPRGEPLRFRAWSTGEPLQPGRFGTVEPPISAPECNPDLLFVPLAAFDRRGFRLGYGAGFYDGALARLRRLKPVRAVGVAFAAQQVDVVPTEPHDQPLDALLTEGGLLEFELV